MTTDDRPLLPTTEAGNLLLAEFIDDESGMATFDVDGLGDAIRAIEAEARAADLRELREEVEGFRERARRSGTWGADYGDDQFCDDVLDIIRRLGE